MNVFVIEPEIIERIKAQMPGVFGMVGSISTYAGYDEIKDKLPALLVAPDSADALGDPNDGVFQTENQRWQLVLMLEHTQNDVPSDADTVTQAAGVLIYQIMQALVGWRPPTKGYKALAYRGRGEPYYEPGYGEFPLFFETGLIITGSGN